MIQERGSQELLQLKWCSRSFTSPYSSVLHFSTNFSPIILNNFVAIDSEMFSYPELASQQAPNSLIKEIQQFIINVLTIRIQLSCRKLDLEAPWWCTFSYFLIIGENLSSFPF